MITIFLRLPRPPDRRIQNVTSPIEKYPASDRRKGVNFEHLFDSLKAIERSLELSYIYITFPARGFKSQHVKMRVLIRKKCMQQDLFVLN